MNGIAVEEGAMKYKYILQYGSLAGWPHKLALGFRKRGIPCIHAMPLVKDALDLDRQFSYDIAVHKKKDCMVVRNAKKLLFLRKALQEYNLIHYHGDTIMSAAHHLFEGKLIDYRGIPMLMSFGGGDARIVSLARQRNKYFYRQPDEKRDRKIRKWLASLSKHISFVATDCEMEEYVKPYFEKVYTFRPPVNLDEIRCVYPSAHNNVPRVLHLPTEPWAKGTEYIEAAVDRLKVEGLSFEFIMIRQLTQKQVYDAIAGCDIYVDELRCGSHGVTAVETMASGKPTITYIREDLVDKYPPEMPLVNANPDTIYTVLKKLIQDGELRHEIGKRSRAYVEKYHALEVVVTDLLRIYREIGYRA